MAERLPVKTSAINILKKLSVPYRIGKDRSLQGLNVIATSVSLVYGTLSLPSEIFKGMRLSGLSHNDWGKVSCEIL